MNISKWKLRSKQAYILTKYSIAKALSYFLPLKDSLWLVCERGTDARDNGYVFLKYLREYHPEIPCVYAITKSSADYNKVACLGNVVRYGSLKHLYYVNNATHIISTHTSGFLWQSNLVNVQILRRFYRHNAYTVFLQHGIIKDWIVGLTYPVYRCDLFICGSKKEYEVIKSTYGHPDGVVQYTGLCRFDNLHDFITKKQILIMPTWRMYLNHSDEDCFVKSDYYLNFSAILSNQRVIELLELYDYELVFYPHYEMQKYIHLFQSCHERVKIAKFSCYDVQTLLKDSALLITDYSSVAFDFAYMKKPLIYFQFDKDKFFSNHYQIGYFNYETMGFGKTVQSIDDLIEEIKSNLDAKCQIKEPYISRINEHYELHDAKNCERVFNCISRLGKLQ